MFEVGQPVHLVPGASVPLPVTAKVFPWPYQCEVSGVRNDTLEVTIRIRAGDGEWVESEWFPMERIIPATWQNQVPHPDPEAWTNEKLGALCREWQGRLRLQDWKVRIRFARAREMPLPECKGTCNWNISLKQADILILDPIDYPPEEWFPQDIECVLIHELEHLHFAPFIPDDKESLEYFAAEQAIELIADALVNAKRGDQPKE